MSNIDDENDDNSDGEEDEFEEPDIEYDDYDDDNYKSPYSPEHEKVISELLDKLRGCFTSDYLNWYDWRRTDLDVELGDVSALDARMLTSRLEKIVLTRIKQRIDENKAYSHEFKEVTGWPILDQILTITRLKEIAAVKLVKKGGRGVGLRYDISDLMATYFGRRILHGLGMQRRRVASKEELETIRAACQKIKLNLPEVIEPTTTEQFFAPLSADVDE